ncbi:uncharacterized protein LOC123532688 [Mercenaria mercenaria]|uniref:uncharacterized protein LOC123532688 n=1 Tax=Mercenaria mercenaria TaxID=6596 RepID=UPI00234E4636|nr:uncharacterized protein LOC123532688 [Mercenaria mercenaria]
MIHKFRLKTRKAVIHHGSPHDECVFFKLTFWGASSFKSGQNKVFLRADISEQIEVRLSDKKRPSMEGKCVPTEADKRHKSHLNATQVRQHVSCQECGKRRVVYCRHRLSAEQSRQIMTLQDSVSFTCGSSLFPESHPLHDEIFVREGLNCQTDIETTYYSAVTQKFQPICFFCGDPNILGNEEEPLATLKTQYSTVRPICRGCLESGKEPAVRNALKMKKKKEMNCQTFWKF